MGIKFIYNDGGRKSAGFRGDAGDCVTRAISIATGLPYKIVYGAMASEQQLICGKRSARNGVAPSVYKKYLAELGWTWTPTMRVGAGCRVHLRADELPTGRIIVRLSRHIAAVIDGVLHDTHDCSRDGARCVYGYWGRPGRIGTVGGWETP